MSRPLVGPRLRRVLAYIPWIADHPGATLGEIATRFDVSVRDLERDLELLPFVGLPPYTADRLIDVELIDDCVWIRFADAFARPLRFTADEGVALLAAGEALMAVPGSDPDGPLARALAKLSSTLNARGSVAVEIVTPDIFDDIRRAITAHKALRISYLSYHRNARTAREIEPWSMASLLGHWYVRAWCRSAQAERLFRADRIETIEILDDIFEPPSDAGAIPDTPYRANEGDERIVLELAPAAAWVLETYPTEAVEELSNGNTRVTMPVSNPEFLARLLLRLGRSAHVVAPETARQSLHGTAQLMLNRYGVVPST
jgi:proteasome accessory factor C